MLDSSHTLLLGLFKKLGVRIKKLEFKNSNIGVKENSEFTKLREEIGKWPS